MPVLDPVGLIGGRAEAGTAVGFVVGVITFETTTRLHALLDNLTDGFGRIELGFLFEISYRVAWRDRSFALKVLIHAGKDAQQRTFSRAIQTDDTNLRAVEIGQIDVFEDSLLVVVLAYSNHGVDDFVWNCTHQNGTELPGGRETRQRYLLGLVHIENSVQFGELEQVRDLPAGVAELHLTPCFPLFALTLRAGIPVSIFIFENRRATGRADCLRHGADGHDQLAETAAIDVRNIFQIEKDLMVPVRDFIADRLPESRDRVTGSNPSGKIYNKDSIRPSC